MRKNIQRFVAGFALSLSVLSLGACGKSSSSASGSNDKNSLTMMYSVDNQEQKTALKWLVDTYKEEKGITVELTELPSSDMKTKLKNAVISKDVPDLVKITGPDLSYADSLMDLTEIFDEYDFKEDYAFKLGNKVISTPMGLTAVGMFINEDLWNEAGVSYPTSDSDVWTWEEFSEKAREVKEKTDAKYGLVMDKSEHRLKNFLYQWDVSLYDEDGTGTLYGSNQAVKAYEFFKEMNDDDLMPKSVYLSGEDAASMYKTGQVAAYYSGSWQVQDFDKNITNFKSIAVRMPYETQRATNAGGDYIAAFDGTGKEKESAEFIRWMYSDEVYTQLCEKYGYLPSLTGISPTYEVANEEYQVFIDELESSSAIPLHDKSFGRDLKKANSVSTDGIVMERISKMINNDLTAQEAADEIGKEINSVTELEIIK